MEKKVCKICGKEKDLNEFGKKSTNNYYKECKVCRFLRDNKITPIDRWSINEYGILLDNILNKRIRVLNEIVHLLNNKTLIDIAELLTYHLKIRNKSQKFEFICKYDKCNNKIIVNTAKYKKGNYKYCCPKCSQRSQIKKIKYNCVNCNKECETIPSKLNNVTNKFCSHECADEYNAEIRKRRVKLECIECGIEFEVKRSIYEKGRKFCTKKCQDKWTVKHGVKGENHPNYSKINMKCDWCKKDIKVSRYKVNSQNNHFCSKDCMYKWHKNVYWKDEQNINKQRENIIKNISQGKYPHTNTSIQIKVEEFLKDLNLNFIKEHTFGYYSIDLFIPKHNLFIEVNGDYWHSNPTSFSKITNTQYINIIRDKTKRKFIENRKIKTLYLWENDIKTNIKLCKSLIVESLSDSHKNISTDSFNYNLTKGKLSKNKLEIECLHKLDSNILKGMIKESEPKINKKQEDKWIKYKCEMCGQQTEGLKSHYKNNKHHFCSTKCSAQFYRSKPKIEVACPICGEVLLKTLSEYKRNKNKIFFCSKDCWKAYLNNKEE